MTKLVLYDAMCRAIAEAYKVDEVKNLRDKAVAIEAYAREAKNRVAEEQARQIRERAERRWGELYAPPKMKAKAGRPGKIGSPKIPIPTLRQMGVTKTQAVRWQEKAAIPPAEFETALQNGRVGLLVKQRQRAKRETALAEKTQVASQKLGSNLYGVIYADPPWRWEPYSRETGMDRAADNHYPTMTLEEIKAFEVPAADDAVLFLWSTSPMLVQALEVMEEWGFHYQSQCVWLKDRQGTGYWFRNKHELLLVGTRGDIPAPAPGEQYPSVIEANVGRHSAKPHHFAEMIEGLFPTLPRIELFARQPRLGWDVLGNEVN